MNSIFRLMTAAIFTLAFSVAAFAQITIQGQSGTFPTIQSAINAAQPNDAVLVNGGTHAENLLIAKPIRVTGLNGAEINPATGIPVTVNNPAGPVHINGFTVRVPAGQFGVNYDGLASNTSNTGTIHSCKFIGGLTVIFAKEADFRIVSNQFNGFTGAAIVVAGNTGNTSRAIRASSNIINGGAVAQGQFLAGTVGIVASNGNLLVSANKITNALRGIQIANSAGTISSNTLTNAAMGIDVTNSPNMLIEQNSSNITSAFSAAINTQLISTFAIRLIGSNSVSILNNTLVGGNAGIICTSQSANATITANIVNGAFVGFQGGGIGLTFTLNSSAEVHFNNIENNVFGLQAIGASANATNNWWGAANGPSGAGGGSGDSIGAGIPFFPFLTAPNPNAGV